MTTLLFLAAAAVPTIGDAAGAVSSISAVVGAAAALGFSIWLYRKVKDMANAALDDGESDGASCEEWEDEEKERERRTDGRHEDESFFD